MEEKVRKEVECLERDIEAVKNGASVFILKKHLEKSGSGLEWDSIISFACHKHWTALRFFLTPKDCQIDEEAIKSIQESERFKLIECLCENRDYPLVVK